MPRTDIPGNNGNGAKQPPALGNKGPRGMSTAKEFGAFLLPFKSDRKLSMHEARFVTEFMKDMEAPINEIAIRAGYSAQSAKSQGTQLMKRPHIKAEIADQMHAFVQRERLSIQRIVRHLIALSEVDKRDYYDDNGALKNPKDWTKEMAALVQGFSVAEIWEGTGRDRKVVGELKKVTLTDHFKSITLLAKSLQGFVDRVDVRAAIHQKTEITHNIGIDYTLLNYKELETLKKIHKDVKERMKTKQKTIEHRGNA